MEISGGKAMSNNWLAQLERQLSEQQPELVEKRGKKIGVQRGIRSR